MGLFTPAWDNPKADINKVAKAIGKVKSQEELKNIYRNAKNPQAAREAIKLINDEDYWVEYICKKTDNFSSQLRKALAGKIRSQENLAKLACYSFYREDYTGGLIAEQAAKRITERNCLLKLLKSDSTEVQWTALDKLDDQDLFAEAVLRDHGIFNAEKAFARIKDQKTKEKLILEIQNDLILSECLSALSKEGYEPDTETLEKLIKKVSDKKYSKSVAPVVRFIKDEERLCDLALHGGKMSGPAIYMITDEKTLAAIAMDPEKGLTYRSYAYEKLEDKSLVDAKTIEYIHENDSRYWSEEDRHMADIMAADSY